MIHRSSISRLEIIPHRCNYPCSARLLTIIPDLCSLERYITRLFHGGWIYQGSRLGAYVEPNIAVLVTLEKGHDIINAADC
jgi:hypothetical protein